MHGSAQEGLKNVSGPHVISELLRVLVLKGMSPEFSTLIASSEDQECLPSSNILLSGIIANHSLLQRSKAEAELNKGLSSDASIESNFEVRGAYFFLKLLTDPRHDLHPLASRLLVELDSYAGTGVLSDSLSAELTAGIANFCHSDRQGQIILNLLTKTSLGEAAHPYEAAFVRGFLFLTSRANTNVPSTLEPEHPLHSFSNGNNRRLSVAEHIVLDDILGPQREYKKLEPYERLGYGPLEWQIIESKRVELEDALRRTMAVQRLIQNVEMRQSANYLSKEAKGRENVASRMGVVVGGLAYLVPMGVFLIGEALKMPSVDWVDIVLGGVCYTLIPTMLAAGVGSEITKSVSSGRIKKEHSNFIDSVEKMEHTFPLSKYPLEALVELAHQYGITLEVNCHHKLVSCQIPEPLILDSYFQR